MGKPTGFIDYLRELPADRQPATRIKDWQEFHEHMDEKKLRDQLEIQKKAGGRCKQA